MKLKFFQLLKHPKMRPSQIVDVCGILHPLSPGQTSCVYKMTDLINDMYYGGKHLDGAKAYWSSTTDKDFQEVLINPESKIILEILFWGTEQEVTEYEHNLLTSVDAANNPKWYNKTNGASGTRPINHIQVDDLRDDINLIRDNFKKQDKINNDEFKIINFNYLTKEIPVIELHKYKRLQVRENAIDRDNIEKIKSAMRTKSTHKLKYHPPVILKNRFYNGIFYSELVISGNHTIVAPMSLGKAFHQSKYLTIEIPEEIHKNFSDAEIYLLANDLNSQKDISSPFTKFDAVKECLFLIKEGNDWQSTEIAARWIDRGLTEANIEWTYKQVNQKLLDKKMVDDGYTIMDYKITHKDILKKEAKKYENDNTFVISFSAAAVKLNRILVPFHKENEKRLSKKKKIKSKIVCLLTFPREDVRTKEWPKLRSDFDYLQKCEKLTPIEYIELPMYSKDII